MLWVSSLRGSPKAPPFPIQDSQARRKIKLFGLLQCVAAAASPCREGPGPAAGWCLYFLFHLPGLCVLEAEGDLTQRMDPSDLQRPQGSSSSPGDPLGTKVLRAQGAEPVPLLPRRMQSPDAQVRHLRSPSTPAAAGGCGNVSFSQLRAAALLLFKHAEQAPSLQPRLSPPCPVPALPGPSTAPNSEDFTHFGDCKPRLSASPAPCRAASSSVVETKRGSRRCS